MEIRQQVSKAIKELHDSPSVPKVIALIDALVEEVRVQNDTATAEEVVANQGKLAGWKELKEYLGPKIV